MGSTREREKFRKVVVRAYGHSEMYSVARSFRGGTLPTLITRIAGPHSIPSVLRDLAELFISLQDWRHLADYDLATTFLRGDVLTLIDDVEQAVADWNSIRTDPAARLFLICLLVWEKIRSK